MSAGAPVAPAGLEVLQAGGGHGLGNALYLDRAAGALLKVYRPRRRRAHAWREGLRSLGHQLFEGKRGTGVRDRLRTETVALRLWAAHGFDVPEILERAIPPGVPQTALWLEYCPGETLDRVLTESSCSAEDAHRWVARLAGDQARRHRKALELSEPLLLQEHATIVHVLRSGDRLVTIDFENAYRRGYPVRIALAQELAGTLRSFFRRVPDRGEELFRAFLETYPERDLLRGAAERVTTGGGIARRLRRWRDEGRRNRPSKQEVMQWALSALAR